MNDVQITPKLAMQTIKNSLIQPRQVLNTLIEEFKKQPNITIHWNNGSMLHHSSILGIDNVRGISIQPKNIISDTNQLRNYQGTVVFSTHNGRYQFPSTINSIDDKGIINLAIPNYLNFYQRRDNKRAEPPSDDSFKMIIGLSPGQELLTNVIDGSSNGIRLEIRSTVIKISQGSCWYGCYFERSGSRSSKFNLRVMHKTMLHDKGLTQVGCELYNPTLLASSVFSNMVSVINQSKVNPNSKQWYVDLNWYKYSIKDSLVNK